MVDHNIMDSISADAVTRREGNFSFFSFFVSSTTTMNEVDEEE